jgi:bis(5'-nucleosyl)-tetraphosphatase (symmetrical)
MADYAIGDVQGCYGALQRLLTTIDFNEKVDRLWFVGDLVNRGPESLAVLRFISTLPIPARITLGNHDLHLLASLFTDSPKVGHDDTLSEILHATDNDHLGHWLRKQPMLYYSEELKVVMCHAGIAPLWDLAKAEQLAQEVELVLASDDFRPFLQNLYGNKPKLWSDSLQGMDRLRAITNYFTRMRFCMADGSLCFDYKGPPVTAPAEIYPWYAVPGRKSIGPDIIFGHWAALGGGSPAPGIYALDTGCLWGGRLTALRLQDRQLFSVLSQV